MIRINLLGQTRPKATRRAVPMEATVQWTMLVVSMVIALGVLYFLYYQDSRRLDEAKQEIESLKAQKAELEQIKQQVQRFEQQKAMLQQRINVIEELQRGRAGGQELLNMVANTVVRTEALWLTSLDRDGNSLSIKGSAGSVKSVADFITQLKRSGYFTNVEIKETAQDDKLKSTQVFLFTLSAEISSSRGPAATPRKG